MLPKEIFIWLPFLIHTFAEINSQEIVSWLFFLLYGNMARNLFYKHSLYECPLLWKGIISDILFMKLFFDEGSEN